MPTGLWEKLNEVFVKSTGSGPGKAITYGRGIVKSSELGGAKNLSPTLTAPFSGITRTSLLCHLVLPMGEK